jgi:hypothetical protein
MLANNWIANCHCADSWEDPEQRWYPKRLLDLKWLRRAKGIGELRALQILSNNHNLEHTKIKLVDTDAIDIASKTNNRFVTLSHCWGTPKSVQSLLKLTSRSEGRFIREGIEFREFSKTFRDVMLFVSRLDRVGYLWM